MKKYYKLLLAAYIVILAWLILLKFSVDVSYFRDRHLRNVNLIPFADYSGANIRELILNFLVFIPLGLLLSVNFKNIRLRRKLVFIFLFSLAAELFQFGFAVGAADITDLISNTSGGLVGLILYRTLAKHYDSGSIDKGIFVAGVGLLLAGLAAAGVLIAHGVRYQSKPPRSMPGTHGRVILE